jgi:DNA-directed RNA polymerase subunit beta'
MLNRAPTLHRLGIQAFEPILVEGKAIKLHPLVCTAFNADFDGDQMAIHLPLSVEAQAECRFLLLSPNNLLKPSDGGPVAVPSQDMVLGIYYLTLEKPGDKGEGKYFKDINEALLAYENKVITLQAPITVRVSKEENGQLVHKNIKSTLGRFIFNEGLPQDLGFVDRSLPENDMVPEINFLVAKKQLKQIIDKCINTHGATKTAEVLDYIKAIGYKYSTISAITVSISDMTVPKEKPQMLAETDKLIERITRDFRRGLLTEEERYKAVITAWDSCDKRLTDALLNGLDQYNNIFMMADSGARGSDKQIKQLAGMRGLMADTTGHTIELPIKSNFREGLDVLEYFMSAHGARKGLSDTALRTADSGYLTRRLVDVSQELIIREMDCSIDRDEIPGMWVKQFADGKEEIESLQERITGRFAAMNIYDKDGNVLVKANHMITPSRAERVMKYGVNEDGTPIDKVKIRTILTCRSKDGICVKCYGANMASGEAVQVGESVGIIAAQSIGEPGTQLTMRTFHTGGVAGGDITQGLPRVEELFEARKPKGLAIISEIPGVIQVLDQKKKREVVVTNLEMEEGAKERQKTYLIPYGSRLKVTDGQVIEAGAEITEGSVNPHDIMKIRGIRAVQDYLLREVQRVYRLQGVEINDKHIEVIVRQMLKKVRIEKQGDTDFLPGSYADFLEFEDMNEKLVAEGKEPAEGVRIVLGITKAALATDSFLSAASFQETTKVLTDAAIKGRIDPLIGLKENVIIGQLIPAGTGLRRYRDVKLDTDARIEEKAALEKEKAEEEARKKAETAKDEAEEDAEDTAEGAEDIADEDLVEDTDSAEDVFDEEETSGEE